MGEYRSDLRHDGALLCRNIDNGNAVSLLQNMPWAALDFPVQDRKRLESAELGRREAQGSLGSENSAQKKLEHKATRVSRE
jgi:hypothetical protein